MQLKKRNRKFQVGINNQISLIDKGSIFLKNNENLSVHLGQNIHYDITKKKWGFYLAPSLNKRLKKFKLQAAIIENSKLKTFFVMAVVNDKNKINQFKNYCKKEELKIIAWLNNKNLNTIKKYFEKN